MSAGILPALTSASLQARTLPGNNLPADRRSADIDAAGTAALIV